MKHVFSLIKNDNSESYLQILKFLGPSVCQSAVKEAKMASLTSLPAILEEESSYLFDFSTDPPFSFYLCSIA